MREHNRSTTSFLLCDFNKNINHLSPTTIFFNFDHLWKLSPLKFAIGLKDTGQIYLRQDCMERFIAYFQHVIGAKT